MNYVVPIGIIAILGLIVAMVFVKAIRDFFLWAVTSIAKAPFTGLSFTGLGIFSSLIMSAWIYYHYYVELQRGAPPQPLSWMPEGIKWLVHPDRLQANLTWALLFYVIVGFIGSSTTSLGATHSRLRGPVLNFATSILAVGMAAFALRDHWHLGGSHSEQLAQIFFATGAELLGGLIIALVVNRRWFGLDAGGGGEG